MAVKTGIQQPLWNSWIPGRASYRQLARNDDGFWLGLGFQETCANDVRCGCY